MKKYTVMILSFFLFSLILLGCQIGKQADTIKVGMLVGSGGLNDQSYNQNLWKGIQRYVEDHQEVKAQFAVPTGNQLEDYITAGENLITAGSNVLVVPGFEFEEMVSELQEKYSDVKFIFFDGEPKQLMDNTLSIYFAENEAGFLVGMAAALESHTQKIGFIGGMKTPSVERFGIGYQAGVAYANHMYQTHTEIADYQFEESFSDTHSGEELAKVMYDEGIDIIFAASGAVGIGVMNEAKVRGENNERVYMIGSDVDQYEAGKILTNESIVLTSAIKKMDDAVYNVLSDISQNQYSGGQVMILDLKSNEVGLPIENPNLSQETLQRINQATSLIKTNKLTAPQTLDELNETLEKYKR